MKEDIEAVLTHAIAWAIGTALWAAFWVVIGVVARLTLIPLSFGWSLI